MGRYCMISGVFSHLTGSMKGQHDRVTADGNTQPNITERRKVKVCVSLKKTN